MALCLSLSLSGDFSGLGKTKEERGRERERDRGTDCIALFKGGVLCTLAALRSRAVPGPCSTEGERRDVGKTLVREDRD